MNDFKPLVESLQKTIDTQSQRIHDLELRLVSVEHGTERDVPWFIKDFNVLYRCALDVSESDTRPTAGCPPPLRHLRWQLERLAPAFGVTQEIRKGLTR